RGFDDGPESELYADISVIGDRVHFIWMDWNDVDTDIFYRYLNGTTWEPEQELSTDTLWERQGGPSIAVEDDEVHAVWYGEGPGDDIYYRRYDGSDWQAQIEISTDSAWERQWSPSIAVQDGKVHVVWADRGDGDWDIYYRLFNGTSWQPEQQVSIDTGNENQSNPSIAVEGDRIHVVWQDTGDGDRDIRYRLHNGTGWEAIQEISTDVGTENQYSPAMATGNGKVHVVWHDNGDGDFDIIYRCLDGSWMPEIEITTDRGTEDQFNPDIAAEGDRVYVTWTDEGDGDRDIYYGYFDGTVWRPEEEVSSDEGAENQRSPAIAVSGGVVHFAWSDIVDGDNDIYYRSAFEDITPPNSEVRNIYPMRFGFPYWVPTTWGISIEWSAQDDEGLTSVSLFYRYSSDNTSWSAWEELARNDSVSGTSAIDAFSFWSGLDGEGFYEFYTVATDAGGNAEPAPTEPDLIAGMDATPPSGSIIINDDE
ncbi:MAG: hypothetical protein KAT00_15005, partial [Planctomycetes bacterium]|nr:hypothetical protein [Planctomycetota bacterium]